MHTAEQRSPFEAPDPAFATRVRASFERQRIMDLLGAEMSRIEPGRTLVVCSADVTVRKDGRETLCATLLQTLMTMRGRPDAA